MGDYASSSINLDTHLLLDQPLLRLPYELLRKNFRSAHFTFEKDTTQVKNLLKETATGSVNGKTSPEDVVKNLDTMLTRLRGMKRKLATYADEEARIYHQVDARVAHLRELESMHSVDDVKYDGWSRRRLDRLLIDYLLRHGYNGSASSLAEERNVGDLVDIDTFVAMSRIQDSLRTGRSVAEALAWCADNKKELRKMDSRLEFMLRYQQYIELVRTQAHDRMLEAIVHAKKHLMPYSNTYPKEVQQAAGLLAFPPEEGAEAVEEAEEAMASIGDERDSPYRALYSQRRWAMLADLFTETHNSLLSLPSCPLLHIALSSGLSALKTPACHSSTTSLPPANTAPAPDKTSGAAAHPPQPAASGAPPPSSSATTAMASMDSVCPICSTELNALARNVPYAHHTQSHVDHDLMLLPNGRAYGKARLEEYARKTGLPSGKVRDLRSPDVFALEEAKKVFIT